MEMDEERTLTRQEPEAVKATVEESVIEIPKEKAKRRVAVKKEGIEYPRWSTVDGKEIMLEELERALMESYRVMDLPCNFKRGKSYRALEKTVRGLEEHVTKLRIDLVGHEVVEVVSVVEEVIEGVSDLNEEIESDVKLGGMAGIMIRDARKVLSKAPKATFKAVMYPIVGSISARFQLGLEGLVGREWFDAVKATNISRKVNLVLYTSAGLAFGGYSGYRMAQVENIPAVLVVGTLGLLTGFIPFALGGQENIMRGDEEEYHFWSDVTKPSASLVGKIISSPFDLAAYSYDMAKSYVESVREKSTQPL